MNIEQLQQQKEIEQQKLRIFFLFHKHTSHTFITLLHYIQIYKTDTHSHKSHTHN